MRDAVDAGDELQVLPHREVLVQAEMLRHVAYMALDLVGVGADVVAEAGAAARVRREQAAQHADSRRLAGAVGAEKAVDLPALHLNGEIAHHLPAVEGFGQSLDRNGDVARRQVRRPGIVGWGCGLAHFPASPSLSAAWPGSADSPRSVTSIGWPTRSFSGSSGSASIRNTS